MKRESSRIQRALDAMQSTAYALSPETLLTPSGPDGDMVIGVTDGEIDFIGSRQEFASDPRVADLIELPGRAIVPGFIDAHTHVGQSFGKSLTGGEPAQIWRRIWVPLEGNHDPLSAYASAKWMFLEALRGGFTTINNFAIVDAIISEAVHRAALDVGIRLVSSTGAVEHLEIEDTVNKADRTKVLDAAISCAEAHLTACKIDPKINPSICISGIQGASSKLMKILSDFCASNNILFQIHTNEHHVEVHWSVLKYGMRPLEYFAKVGAVGAHTLHHHSTLVTDDEIELLRETRSGVSYNPLASLWKGDRVAPALGFASRGVRFGIGSDSTRLDAFRLLETAENCQRFASGMQLADFSCGAAWTWVDAATRGSADVTGLGDQTGELKVGLRADFLILDKQRPEVLPSWDFEWELVRLYNRDQIDAVVVDGTPVVVAGQPVGWSMQEFLRESLPIAKATVGSAEINRRHSTSTVYRRKAHTGEQIE